MRPNRGLALRARAACEGSRSWTDLSRGLESTRTRRRSRWPCSRRASAAGGVHDRQRRADRSGSSCDGSIASAHGRRGARLLRGGHVRLHAPAAARGRRQCRLRRHRAVAHSRESLASASRPTGATRASSPSCYRAGVLTTVSPPTPEQEAIRDLCRCREDVRADLGRCRHRLVKMLVRRGFVFNSTQPALERSASPLARQRRVRQRDRSHRHRRVQARDRPGRASTRARSMPSSRRRRSSRSIASTSHGCAASAGSTRPSR